MGDYSLRTEYTEVLELLNYIDKDELKKIPAEEIENLNKYKDDSYVFVYEENKMLEEQNISRAAYIVLLRLYYDYILEENEKKILKDILKLNELKSEKEKELNYLLYNKEVFPKNNNEKMSVELVEVKKENILKKFFRFLKNFLYNK